MTSGYWSNQLVGNGKFLGAFFRTLQYSYLFGIVPALMVGAIDDISITSSALRPWCGR